MTNAERRTLNAGRGLERRLSAEGRPSLRGRPIGDLAVAGRRRPAATDSELRVKIGRMPMTPAQIEAVRELLTTSRVLSLALIVEEAPVNGLLPFAVTPDYGALVVHASQLARHTKGLHDGAPSTPCCTNPSSTSVDALQVKRVTLRGVVRVPEDGTPAHDALRGCT